MILKYLSLAKAQKTVYKVILNEGREMINKCCLRKVYGFKNKTRK